MTFALQKTIFGFLVMLYHRVGDGKFLYENIGLGSPRFHTTSHLKIEAKKFFVFTLMPQCNS